MLELCNEVGLENEFENVLDKLWLINVDVQKYMHPEAVKYQLDYEYGKDDWRTYMEILDKNKEKIAKLEAKNEENHENVIIQLGNMKNKIRNSS